MALCPTSAVELAKLHRANAAGQRQAAEHFDARSAEAELAGDVYTAGELHGMAHGLRITADYLDGVAAELESLARAN